MYSVNNGLAVFGGGYMLTLYHDGKVFFHYPDGAMGAETSLYSGARKNIACLVNLTLTKMSPKECNGQTGMTYRLSRETKNNVPLAYLLRGISDVYEFPTEISAASATANFASLKKTPRNRC